MSNRLHRDSFVTSPFASSGPLVSRTNAFLLVRTQWRATSVFRHCELYLDLDLDRRGEREYDRDEADPRLRDLDLDPERDLPLPDLEDEDELLPRPRPRRPSFFCALPPSLDDDLERDLEDDADRERPLLWRFTCGMPSPFFAPSLAGGGERERDLDLGERDRA